MSEPPIHILLATWNGERFLRAQLDSIRAQAYPHWRLLVRDDDSDDGTAALLREAARDDARVQILDRPHGRLGSAGNFFALMQHALEAGAHHFALCDQDDIWLPGKLSVMRAAMQRLERLSAQPAPVLVCSDLEWIDAADRLLARSHFRRAGAQRALADAGLWLLAMNVIPGCSMLGNRALLEAALPRPDGVTDHDWWLALVAAASGRMQILDEPLVRYRQHDGNAIGARTLLARLREASAAPAAVLDKGLATYWQAVENAKHASARLPADGLHPGWAKALRHTVDELGSSRRWRRAAAVLHGPVRRLGWPRNVLMLLAALAAQNAPRPHA